MAKELVKELEVKEIKKEPIKVEKPVVIVDYMSFDRWFNSTGRNPRHKAGMVAFANTLVRRTKENWDKVFKNY